MMMARLQPMTHPPAKNGGKNMPLMPKVTVTNRDNGACAPPLFASWQALLLNHHQMTHYQQIQL
jgi:hypothetical protein